MLTVKLSQGGRVVIPSAMREKLNMNQGDELIIEERDGELVLASKRQRLKKIQAEFHRLFPPKAGVSGVDELMAERKTEAMKEETETQEWLHGLQNRSA